MSYNLSFIFVFLPVGAAVYYLLSPNLKRVWLVVLSLLLVAYTDIYTCATLLFAVLPGYIITRLIWRYEMERKKAKLVFNVGFCLYVLAMIVFGVLLPMYLDVSPLFGVFSISISVIMYTLKLVRGELEGSDGAFSFLLYCLFFGKLGYGPTVKPEQLMPSIRRGKISTDLIVTGVGRLSIGLLKFAVVTPTLDNVINDLQSLPTFDHTPLWALCLIVIYSIYITVLLTSFSDVAVGLGRVFSINLPRNVYYPFLARTPSEFVFRLNMTLSECVEYIATTQFSLTGKRRTIVVAAVSSLLLVFWIDIGVSGLIWWGLLLFCLICEQFLGALTKYVPNIVRRMFNCILMLLLLPSLIGDSFTDSVYIWQTLFTPEHFTVYTDGLLYALSTYLVVIPLGLLMSLSMFDFFIRRLSNTTPTLFHICSMAQTVVCIWVTVSFLV